MAEHDDEVGTIREELADRLKFFYDQVRRTGHEPDAKKLIAVSGAARSAGWPSRKIRRATASRVCA